MQFFDVDIQYTMIVSDFGYSFKPKNCTNCIILYVYFYAV